MNWSDPVDRARLAEQVGPDEYNRQHAAHIAASTVETVAGHALRPQQTRFGLLWAVGTTGSAFTTMADARAHALANPVPA